MTRTKENIFVHDANDYALETRNDPKYPLERFLHVLTVRLETLKIVRSLPDLAAGIEAESEEK